MRTIIQGSDDGCCVQLLRWGLLVLGAHMREEVLVGWFWTANTSAFSVENAPSMYHRSSTVRLAKEKGRYMEGVEAEAAALGASNMVLRRTRLPTATLH